MATISRVRRRGVGRPLAVAAIAIGAMLLGAAALVLRQGFNAPPPYRYEMGDLVPPGDLDPAFQSAAAGVAVHRAVVMSTSGDTPLAKLEVADSTQGPILLKWDSQIDDPFLKLPPPLREVTSLAAVIERHMPADGRLLAWWDSSRQLGMLSGAKPIFDSYLGMPLFLPASWRAGRSGAERVERAFWDSGHDTTAQAQRFKRFVDALLADEKEGMKQLRALGDGKPLVLVLHVRDVILLGQMAPEKIGVAFQDMPDSGDVHGMVKSVHGWLTRHDYSAYTVMRSADRPLRVVALTDAPSGMTLAARLLPFIGNSQSRVEGATLVYQTGGFSVYEIPPEIASDAKAES